MTDPHIPKKISNSNFYLDDISKWVMRAHDCKLMVPNSNDPLSSGAPEPSSARSTEPDPPKPVEISAAAAAAKSGLPKIISFDSLARCGDEIWIENGGQIYRLRKTKQGKLILTK